VTAYLGPGIGEHLDLDRSEFDYSPHIRLESQDRGPQPGDINLPQQFGAIATRVRRGDVEMLAHDDTCG